MSRLIDSPDELLWAPPAEAKILLVGEVQVPIEKGWLGVAITASVHCRTQAQWRRYRRDMISEAFRLDARLRIKVHANYVYLSLLSQVVVFSPHRGSRSDWSISFDEAQAIVNECHIAGVLWHGEYSPEMHDADTDDLAHEAANQHGFDGWEAPF